MTKNELRPNYYKAQVTGLDKDGNRVAVEVQPFDIIDALSLGFYEGNVLKYLWRMGRKHTERLDDAKKVVTYAQQVLRCVGGAGAPEGSDEASEQGVLIRDIVFQAHQLLDLKGAGPRGQRTLLQRLEDLKLLTKPQENLIDIITEAHQLLDASGVPRQVGSKGWTTLLDRMKVLAKQARASIMTGEHDTDADVLHDMLDAAGVVSCQGENGPVLSLKERLYRLVGTVREQEIAIKNGQNRVDELRRDLADAEKRVTFLEKELDIRNDLLSNDDEPTTSGCSNLGNIQEQLLCAQRGCGFCRAAEYKMGNRTDFDAVAERARRRGESVDAREEMEALLVTRPIDRPGVAWSDETPSSSKRGIE